MATLIPAASHVPLLPPALCSERKRTPMLLPYDVHMDHTLVLSSKIHHIRRPNGIAPNSARIPHRSPIRTACRGTCQTFPSELLGTHQRWRVCQEPGRRRACCALVRAPHLSVSTIPRRVPSSASETPWPLTMALRTPVSWLFTSATTAGPNNADICRRVCIRRGQDMALHLRSALALVLFFAFDANVTLDTCGVSIRTSPLLRYAK